MRINMRVTGDTEIRAQIRRINSECEDDIKKETRKVLRKMRKQAFNNAPERTPEPSERKSPKIKKSLRTKVKKNLVGSLYVLKKTFYSLFQEMGTEKMEANSFIRPALEDHKDEYYNRVTGLFQGLERR